MPLQLEGSQKCLTVIRATCLHFARSIKHSIYLGDLMNAKKRTIAAAVALAGAMALTSCSPGGEETAQEESLTVWTLERQPDRVEIQKQIAADFTKQSGVDVEIVAVDEAQYNQLLVSSAASGERPAGQ
jgi:multiple sugar transport system substrate-binding protein